MKIIYSYLLKEFFKYLVAALVSLAVFYIVVDFISNIGAFTKHAPDAGYIFLYYLYKLPEIMYRVLPLSVLLSTLLLIGFLKKNNEIVIIKSSGMGMFKFFTPLFFAGAAISILAFLLSNFVAVRANVLRKVVMQKYITGNKSYDINSVYMFKTKNIVLHYKEYSITAKSFVPAEKKMKGINIYVFNPDFSLNRRYIAPAGYVGKRRLLLKGGRLDKFIDEGKKGFEEKHFEKAYVPVSLNMNFFKSYTLKPEFLSLENLASMLSVAEKSGSGINYILTNIYSKISYPLINLILILVGVSVGFAIKEKTGSGAAIGISLVVAFIWWIINSIAVSLGDASQLDPLLAGFMADIIFLFFAAYLIMDID